MPTVRSVTVRFSPLTVTSSFAEGWFILSDDGGKSLLSYVNLVDASTPGELVRDVYGEVNEGSSRFGGPAEGPAGGLRRPERRL